MSINFELLAVFSQFYLLVITVRGVGVVSNKKKMVGRWRNFFFYFYFSPEKNRVGPVILKKKNRYFVEGRA